MLVIIFYSILAILFLALSGWAWFSKVKPEDMQITEEESSSIADSFIGGSWIDGYNNDINF